MLGADHAEIHKILSTLSKVIGKGRGGGGGGTLTLHFIL